MFIYRCTLNIHMSSGPNYWCLQISLCASLTMTASSNFTLQVRVTKPHLLQPTISALSIGVDKRHQAYSVHCGHYPLGNHEEWVHTVSKPNLFNSAGVCLHRTAKYFTCSRWMRSSAKGCTDDGAWLATQAENMRSSSKCSHMISLRSRRCSDMK